MARVISNLLSNVIKFTSEGIITISVEKDETDKNEKNCVNINVKTGQGYSQNRIDLAYLYRRVLWKLMVIKSGQKKHIYVGF